MECYFKAPGLTEFVGGDGGAVPGPVTVTEAERPGRAALLVGEPRVARDAPARHPAGPALGGQVVAVERLEHFTHVLGLLRRALVGAVTLALAVISGTGRRVDRCRELFGKECA